MKKNDWILLITTILYSWLFFLELPGINSLIFNFVIVVSLLVIDPKRIQKLAWIVAAMGTLLTGACVWWYGDIQSVISGIICLGVLAGVSFEPRSSVFVTAMMSIFYAVSSFAYMLMDWITRAEKSRERRKQGIVAKRNPLIWILPTVAVIVFFLLYRASNAVYNEFTKEISFEWLTMERIGFTLIGFLALYGLYNYRALGKLIGWDAEVSNEAPDSLIEPAGVFDRFLPRDQKLRSGVILLLTLNLLILSVNLVDIHYIVFNDGPPEGMIHSDYVHQGVWALVTSIILAIGIILVYFNSELNYHSKNGTLRVMAYAWMIQNAYMIYSSFLRNSMYIEANGLTQKRIGVYIYLGLALIGLLFTLVKIFQSRSNHFLFRTTGWSFYIVMVMACFVPWNQIIVTHNLTVAHEPGKDVDLDYLFKLSSTTLPPLIESRKASLDSANGVWWSQDRINRLDRKITRFLTSWDERSWKSWCPERTKSAEQIIELNKDGAFKSLQADRCGLDSLNGIGLLTNLEELNLYQNRIQNLDDLQKFKNLKYLNVGANHIESLDVIAGLSSLVKLDLSYNQIQDLSLLKKLQNLEELSVYGSHVPDWDVFTELPKLRRLTITPRNEAWRQYLAELLPEVEIIETHQLQTRNHGY